MPEPDDSTDFECQLVAAAVDTWSPGLSALEMKQLLMTRESNDDEADAESLELLECFATSEMLEDVSGRGEREFIKKSISSLQKATKSKRDKEKHIDILVKERSKAMKKKVVKPKAAPKAAAAPAPKPDDRWWNSIPGDAKFIQAHSPHIGFVAVDDANGRFRLHYPTKVPKSVSWTSRGMRSASLELLRWWWKSHQDAGNGAPSAAVQTLMEGVAWLCCCRSRSDWHSTLESD